jgi:nicotinamide-nucleotide amidase
MIEPDIDGITRRLAKAALAKRAMVVTAESCTGGGAAQAITNVSGSAKWFDRGLVTYSNTAKRDLLGVKARTLANHGAVSAAVAREMALGALGNGGPGTVSVAITGIAGPTGGSKSKPVGTVWFAWAARGGDLVQARGFRFRGNRGQVQRQAVAVALQGLVDLLR